MLKGVEKQIITSLFGSLHALAAKESMQTRKRPASEPLLENGPKSKTETKLCTPFCDTDCAFKGKHNNLILSLVQLKESSKSSLEEWISTINAIKESFDLNQPLKEADPELNYPLLHWAATLGKLKAVKWLLQQKFITLIANPEDLKSSPPNISNETVLFSAVRYLHEGITTRETYDICKVFTNLLAVFLKHDPRVMLVQEGFTKDTVLHLCARGETGLNAPSFGYLRRILGTLHEYYKEKSRLPIRDILGRKNAEGDTFLHVLAKNDNKEEARNLINFAKGKFLDWKFLKMENADGKTADAVLKEVKLNVETFEISSSDSEDDVPLQHVLDRKSKVESFTTSSRPVFVPLVTFENRSPSDGDSHDKETPRPDNVLPFKRKATVAANTDDEIKKKSTESPGDFDIAQRSALPNEDFAKRAHSSRLKPQSTFTGSVTDEVNFHSTSSQLQQLDPNVRGFRQPNAFLDEKPIDLTTMVSYDAETDNAVVSGNSAYLPCTKRQEASTYSLCATHQEASAYHPCATHEGKFKAETLNKAKGIVEKQMREIEIELLKDTDQLEEAQCALRECKEKMRRLREENDEKEKEIENLKEIVQAKVNLLNSYKDFRSKLV